MSKQIEILNILIDVAHYETTLGDALAVARKIEALYTFDADTWLEANIETYRNPVRKIQAIKDVRAASNEYNRDQWLGLKEAKDLVEEAFSNADLKDLRDKLLNDEPVDPWAESYDLGENEDRAFAESRERQAERGTWFGIDGPLDQEPF